MSKAGDWQQSSQVVASREANEPSGEPFWGSIEGSPSHEPRVLVIIPAVNEAGTIGALIESLRPKYSVLVIDDGSTDDTPEVAAAAGAEVVSHPVNLRKGAALKTGFTWALERNYEVVITMDADGQHDPVDIEKVINSYRRTKCDLIIGERDFSQMPFPNRLATPLGAKILSLALGIRVTDNQSGYRLLTRTFLERASLRSSGYEMEVEMIWEAIRLGMPMAWVPIRTIYFPDRKSGFRPIIDTAHFLKMVWKIWRERVNQNSRTQTSMKAREP